MKILSLLFLLFFALTLKGQNESSISPAQAQKIDSLLKQIDTTKLDTIKVIQYSVLCKWCKIFDPDTALYFAEEGLNLAEKINYLKGVSITSSDIGNIYFEKDNFTKSLEYYQKSLKIGEELKNKKIIAKCYGSIANVHGRLMNLPKALEYNLKSQQMCQELGLKNEVAVCYITAGNIYYEMLDYPKAVENYQDCIKLSEELGNKKFIASCLNNLGAISVLSKKYIEALDYFKRALLIRKQIGYKLGIAGCYGNLAEVSLDLEKFKEAKEYAEISIEIAKEVGSVEIESQSYEHLSKAYKGLNNYSKALENYEFFKMLSDSIISIEKNKELAKMEAVFQNEKKQKEIELLNKDKEKQAAISAAESRKQEAIIHSVVVILLLVMVFAFLSTRSYLQKRSANVLLAQQKVEIEEKNEELNQQNEEIAAQRDALGQLNEEVTAQRDDLFVQRKIAIEQRDEIIRQKKNITDSIAYAKHIQTAMLPNQNEINQVLPNNFVFFKPLDIVSGDFYWVHNINGKSIIAVADCTGHGVPGAFMSVMGLNFLNSIVVEQGVTDPGDVLNRLNSLVINALSHEDAHFQDKDGMDISICCIDWSKMNISYSCARNKIIVCRGKEILQSDANRFSIGKSPFAEKIEFVTGSLSVDKGDMIYLMTDGFVDQFGGPQRIKFLTSRFKKLVLEVAHLEPISQKAILEKTIDEWQSNYHQIDDMLIVGFRI